MLRKKKITGVTAMTKIPQPPGKSSSGGDVRNGHARHRRRHHHVLGKAGAIASPPSHPLTHWIFSSTIFKATAVVILLAVAPVLLISDFGLHRESTEAHSVVSSSSSEENENGGWRTADEHSVTRFWSETCHVERLSVLDLDSERFEREFRFKKPVIVTFPNGASDWTEPRLWSRDHLNSAFGTWKVSSGNSVEIVRRGGNGDIVSSLDQFTADNLNENDTSSPPSSYIFDRNFFKDSELSASLKLPPYFSSDPSEHSSLFFLGASGSGVVFHKHSDTWNGVVFGQKRWFLYPGARSPPGGVYPGFSIVDWYDFVYPNLTASQRPLECVQGGGEILYLPEGMYHATINIGHTIAVAFQKKEATLLTEQLMYKVTELNKELDQPDADHQTIHQSLLTLFLKLRQLLPDNAEMAMKLGEKLGDVGQHSKAVQELRAAIDMDPYFVVAFSTLGNNLAKLRKDREAEEALRHAIELSPRLWDVYKEYGEFLLKKGRYAEAVPVFTKGTELAPNLLPFWSYLKVAQERSGDLEGADKTTKWLTQLKKKQHI